MRKTYVHCACLQLKIGTFLKEDLFLLLSYKLSFLMLYCLYLFKSEMVVFRLMLSLFWSKD
jgi:hypothetical protein